MPDAPLEQPLPVPPPIDTNQSLKWDTTADARHSARVIMDEMGLTGVVDRKTGLKAKDLLCAVIQAESGFKVRAYNKNRNGSSDHGIVQMNTEFWIGPGKHFASVEEVYSNPEKSIRFMVDAYKKGKLTWWYGYVNKSYLKYLPKEQ